MEKWQGKTAVVTGASAGMGAVILRDFAKKGINVIGLARRPERIEAMAKELGTTPGTIHAFKCDVTDRESIKTAFAWIEEKFKVIHILVNNAGIGKRIRILNDNLDGGDELDQVINTNFHGMVHVTRHAYQLMRVSEDYGMIININSIFGHTTVFPPIAECTGNVYHGTKFAITATTDILVVSPNLNFELSFQFLTF